MRRPLAAAFVLATTTLAVAEPLRAQGPERAGTDYLVGQPSARVALSLGWDQPLAGSDFWDFAFDQFLFPRGGIGAPRIGAELGFRAGSRLEIVLGAAYANRRASHEYRDFVDNDDRPIEQETRLRRIPLTVGARYNLVPAGRTVGTIAYVPRRVVPWVGAGGGVMHWTMRQQGDFVDFADSSVFFAEFDARGWAPLAYASAGVDVGLTPGSALAFEARYTRARDRLGRDFTGFAPLDLSGVLLTAGLSWRF